MKTNGVIFKKMEVIEETVRKLRELDDLTVVKLEEDFFPEKGH